MTLITLIPILGGLLLTLGNYLAWTGNIYRAVMVFLLADSMWIIMAVATTNFFGLITTIAGVVFSVLVVYKMYYGKFHKDLHKGDV